MPREFKITDAQQGAAFTVRVVTRANEVEIVGIQDDGSLKIRLTETPNEGRANAQLIAYLAGVLEVDPSQIEIVAGEDKPNKIISVEGVSPNWIEQRLVRGG
ncbi:MAG TPA: DUF167 domain-containing protein [Aggregatilineaceae bacterium]|nr:DUF167 domain-containing protein [Aggregatilineaceae bacterium]